MQDRLQDLYAVRTSGDFSENELVEVPIDVDRLEVPEGLQEFTQTVENLRAKIVQLRSNMETLHSGHRSLLISTETRKHEEINSVLEQQIDSDIHEIAEALKKMSSENKVAVEHARWRNNVHAHLTKRFMDVLIQFRHQQTEYREKVQERIRQRLQIVKPDATPEEVQQVVSGGKLNVFAQQLHEENQIQAREALTYVEGRHQELIKIENSVNELHQMFSDMAILVNLQGEYIDNIEANVAQTGEFVIQANKDLVGAMKKTSRRRKCCCIWMIVLMVLIIIGVIVLVGVGKSYGLF